MHVEFYAQSVGCHNARYGDNWRSRGRMSRASLTSTSELTEFIFFSSFRIFHFRPIRFTTSCSESILFLSRGVTVDIKFVTKATLIQTCMCVCVCVCVCMYIYSLSPVALRPNAGHGLLILEVSRSHTTTHHSR